MSMKKKVTAAAPPAKAGSPARSLNKEDLKKVGVGLLIAMVGAAATYAEEMVPHIDFGVWTPVAVAFNSALVNFIRKWLTDHQ